MNLPYELQIGWRQLRSGRFAGRRRNRFVAFIAAVSMAGITLGVAALIVVLSVINGFEREVRSRMLAAIPHVEVLDSRGTALPDPQGLAEHVRRAPGAADQVLAVAPFTAQPALLGRGEVLRGVLVRGVDPSAEAGVSPLFAALPAEVRAALQPGARAIVLGRTLAQKLRARPGDSVVVLRAGDGAGQPTQWLPFTVAGTFEVGHHEYDSSLALVHLADAAQTWRLGGATGLQVRLKDAQAAPAVAQALLQALEPGWVIREWTRSNRIWFESVQIQKRMIALILVLIVAVAAFNLVSTLVMTVTEKRAEIAILRTLGASPASIMAVFVVQGAAVGVLGTAAGVALGLLLATNIDVLVPALERVLNVRFLDPSIYFIDRLPSEPRASDIGPIAAISVLLSLLATLYPSWRASRVQPAQALRHE